MTQAIVPFIAYEDAAAAIDWLTNAFAFRENESERRTTTRAWSVTPSSTSATEA